MDGRPWFMQATLENVAWQRFRPLEAGASRVFPRTATFCSLVLTTFLSVSDAGAAPSDRMLRHDTGKVRGKQSMTASGHAVSFRVPRGEWYVRSVLVHGSRYGKADQHTFTVAVCDTELRSLTDGSGSFGAFREGLFTWVEVPVKPVRVRRSVKVVADFRPTRTHGVYVAYCDVARSHSSYARPGGTESRFAKGKEWMIRVRLSPSARPLPQDETRMPEAIRKRQGRGTPVVWDPEKSARQKLDSDAPLKTLDKNGDAYLLQWGVIFVTQRRLAPTAQAEPTDIESMPLFDGLHHRRIDIDVRRQSPREAVEAVARWFDVEVDWQPDSAGRKFTMHADGVLGRDALDLMLVPFGYSWKVSGHRIAVTTK